MTLLVQVTNNGVVSRHSKDGVALEHYWDGDIVSFSAPKIQLAEAHGGYAEISFGSIEFIPTAVSSPWPPSKVIEIVAYNTETDETALDVYFEGTGYLRSCPKETAIYDIYATDYSTNLLDDGTDYDGNDVVLPMAIGTVSYVTPVRLADQNGHQCYHLADIQGTIHSDWHVFADGVDVCSNVTNVASNKFEYTVVPGGTLTMSGTGSNIDLVDLFVWSIARIDPSMTMDYSKAWVSSPAINYYATSQDVLIDFMSKVSAWNTHLFYIKSNVLYLVAMDIDNGTRTITEFDYFDAPISYRAPVSKLSASYQTRSYNASNEMVTTEVERSLMTSYQYGTPETYHPYNDVAASVDAVLAIISLIVESPVVTLKIPMQGTLPNPGEKISWTDESFYLPIDLSIRARSISHDPDNYVITIEGEGAVT